MKLIVRTLQLALSLGTMTATQALLAEDGKYRCISDVTSYSNQEKMSAGDFSPNVYWRDVKLSDTSIGYGPSGNREDEITIIDGQVILTHPLADGTIKVSNHPDPNKGAAMLQVSSPSSWIEAASLEEISSFDDLNFVMDELSDEIGCGDDVLLPFKIIGHAKNMVWSLDTHPEHLVKESANQNVTIVGLFNKNQKEKLYMVRGYNIHAHVYMKGIQKAGHMRNLELSEGSKLFLPEKN